MTTLATLDAVLSRHRFVLSETWLSNRFLYLLTVIDEDWVIVEGRCCRDAVQAQKICLLGRIACTRSLRKIYPFGILNILSQPLLLLLYPLRLLLKRQLPPLVPQRRPDPKPTQHLDKSPGKNNPIIETLGPPMMLPRLECWCSAGMAERIYCHTEEQNKAHRRLRRKVLNRDMRCLGDGDEVAYALNK